jgi:hypothetical protein
MLKFEKVCERKFFELLKVSTLKFEVLENFFKLLKGLSFKCVKKSSLPILQVSSQISSLCKKVFQVFEGFL